MIYKLKVANLTTEFGALSDNVYYGETGRKVNTNFERFKGLNDQIIYIETGVEDSGYYEGKDIVLGRFEVYGNLVGRSSNPAIMNAEIGYTQENGQLNSLTIPKNSYPGKINVYVVKPDVKPIIESKYDPKNVLTNGEIICKSSIDVDLIPNITDIESLQYSLVKDQPQNMNGSFIKDNYRVLNKNTKNNTQVTIKGLDIVNRVGKDKPQYNINYTTSNTANKKELEAFIGDRVLNKISTQSGEKINLDGLDIDILGLTKFFKETNIKGSTILGDMEIKYLTMELTLDVNVNGKTETEKVGVIWNTSLKDAQ
ncbi:hypothetical protein PN290_07880 [Romboutsia sp. 1001216sp1]|uniref:hypothetical protein n=1 Tax=unclassified Romboutsia TaxID=2626894 RepID=UPI0018AC729B|nr:MULTISPECIES: hypothetical protein [unclassified Romboutsia]MDB8792708.1 hypothetical protein [Romboutsia sp. 1001216sp1]MDB8795487.1 hypothetical protein [Romboutsia sp. 1001216sp1]MDB8799300.1 hypothetical protein [Romboutsia sp. 1001216sp1]